MDVAARVQDDVVRGQRRVRADGDVAGRRGQIRLAVTQRDGARPGLPQEDAVARAVGRVHRDQVHGQVVRRGRMEEVQRGAVTDPGAVREGDRVPAADGQRRSAVDIRVEQDRVAAARGRDVDRAGGESDRVRRGVTAEHDRAVGLEGQPVEDDVLGEVRGGAAVAEDRDVLGERDIAGRRGLHNALESLDRAVEDGRPGPGQDRDGRAGAVTDLRAAAAADRGVEGRAPGGVEDQVLVAVDQRVDRQCACHVKSHIPGRERYLVDGGGGDRTESHGPSRIQLHATEGHVGVQEGVAVPGRDGDILLESDLAGGVGLEDAGKRLHRGGGTEGRGPRGIDRDGVAVTVADLGPASTADRGVELSRAGDVQRQVLVAVDQRVDRQVVGAHPRGLDGHVIRRQRHLVGVRAAERDGARRLEREPVERHARLQVGGDSAARDGDVVAEGEQSDAVRLGDTLLGVDRARESHSSCRGPDLDRRRGAVADRERITDGAVEVRPTGGVEDQVLVPVHETVDGQSARGREGHGAVGERELVRIDRRDQVVAERDRAGGIQCHPVEGDVGLQVRRSARAGDGHVLLEGEQSGPVSLGDAGNGVERTLEDRGSRRAADLQGCAGAVPDGRPAADVGMEGRTASRVEHEVLPAVDQRVGDKGAGDGQDHVGVGGGRVGQRHLVGRVAPEGHGPAGVEGHAVQDQVGVEGARRIAGRHCDVVAEGHGPGGARLEDAGGRPQRVLESGGPKRVDCQSSAGPRADRGTGADGRVENGRGTSVLHVEGQVLSAVDLGVEGQVVPRAERAQDHSAVRERHLVGVIAPEGHGTARGESEPVQRHVRIEDAARVALGDGDVLLEGHEPGAAGLRDAGGCSQRVAKRRGAGRVDGQSSARPGTDRVHAADGGVEAGGTYRVQGQVLRTIQLGVDGQDVARVDRGDADGPARKRHLIAVVAAEYDGSVGGERDVVEGHIGVEGAARVAVADGNGVLEGDESGRTRLNHPGVGVQRAREGRGAGGVNRDGRARAGPDPGATAAHGGVEHGGVRNVKDQVLRPVHRRVDGQRVTRVDCLDRHDAAGKRDLIAGGAAEGDGVVRSEGQAVEGDTLREVGRSVACRDGDVLLERNQTRAGQLRDAGRRVDGPGKGGGPGGIDGEGRPGAGTDGRAIAHGRVERRRCRRVERQIERPVDLRVNGQGIAGARGADDHAVVLERHGVGQGVVSEGHGGAGREGEAPEHDAVVEGRGGGIALGDGHVVTEYRRACVRGLADGGIGPERALELHAPRALHVEQQRRAGPVADAADRALEHGRAGAGDGQAVAVLDRVLEGDGPGVREDPGADEGDGIVERLRPADGRDVRRDRRGPVSVGGDGRDRGARADGGIDARSIGTGGVEDQVQVGAAVAIDRVVDIDAGAPEREVTLHGGRGIEVEHARGGHCDQAALHREGVGLRRIVADADRTRGIERHAVEDDRAIERRGRVPGGDGGGVLEADRGSVGGTDSGVRPDRVRESDGPGDGGRNGKGRTRAAAQVAHHTGDVRGAGPVGRGQVQVLVTAVECGDGQRSAVPAGGQRRRRVQHDSPEVQRVAAVALDRAPEAERDVRVARVHPTLERGDVARFVAQRHDSLVVQGHRVGERRRRAGERQVVGGIKRRQGVHVHRVLEGDGAGALVDPDRVGGHRAGEGGVAAVHDPYGPDVRERRPGDAPGRAGVQDQIEGVAGNRADSDGIARARIQRGGAVKVDHPQRERVAGRRDRAHGRGRARGRRDAPGERDAVGHVVTEGHPAGVVEGDGVGDLVVRALEDHCVRRVGAVDRQRTGRDVPAEGDRVECIAGKVIELHGRRIKGAAELNVASRVVQSEGRDVNRPLERRPAAVLNPESGHPRHRRLHVHRAGGVNTQALVASPRHIDGIAESQTAADVEPNGSWSLQPDRATRGTHSSVGRSHSEGTVEPRTVRSGNIEITSHRKILADNHLIAGTNRQVPIERAGCGLEGDGAGAGAGVEHDVGGGDARGHVGDVDVPVVRSVECEGLRGVDEIDLGSAQ